MHSKRLCTALIFAFSMTAGIDASAQSHYITNQAQENYDLGISLEQRADQSKNRTASLEDAAKAYRRAIESDPYMVQAYIRLGYVLYALNRSDEGIRVLETGLKRHPDDIELKQYLGLNHYQAGHTHEAESILSEIANGSSGILPEIYFILGKIALDKGDAENTQKYFEAYAKAAPEDAKAWQALSSVYIQSRNIPHAEEALNELLKITPNDTIALINMGHVQYELSNYDAAIERYHQALKLDPQREDLLYTVASVYYLTQKYEQAIKHFEKVLSIHPDHMSAQYFIADSYLKLGNLDKSDTLFKALLEKMPKYRYIKLKLAYIRLLRGDKNAISEVKKQLKNATHPDDLHFGAVLVRKRGDIKTSVNIHKKLYNSHENEPIYGIYLAREYVEQKQYSKAEDILKKIIEKDKEPLALEMLSFVLLRKGADYLLAGDYTQARKTFDDAQSLNIHAVEASCNQAQLLLIEGNRDEAWRTYLKAEQLSADAPSVIKLSAQFDILDGHYDSAITKLESLSQKSTLLPGGSGWYLMAIAKSNAGQWDEAADALSMAEKFGVKDSPASASLSIQKAIQLLQRNDYTQAENAFNQASKLKDFFTPADKVRYDYISALISMRNRKFAVARTSLENAKTGFGKLSSRDKSSITKDGTLDLSFEQSYVLYELNNYDAALSIINGHSSAESKSLEAAIRRKLAFQAMKKQQYNEAQEQFNKISSLSSLNSTDQYNHFLTQVYQNKISNPSEKFEKFSKQNIPEALLNYAIYLDQAGNAELAKVYYKKYISSGKGNHIEEASQILSAKERVWGPASK